MYTVYKHTAPNGKVYIGITSLSVNDRWKNGFGYYRNEHFYKAITKYGWGNIKHEILFENLSREEAEQKEIELISEYQSYDKQYGYNCTNGGECIGKHTDETRQKISDSKKGKFHNHTEETKEKIRQSHLGKRHTEEAKIRVSTANKGRKRSEEQRRMISERNKGELNPLYGKHHSEETKEKMRQVRLGTKLSEETKAKMSARRKGAPTGRTGEKSPNSKPVICIETSVIYSCAAEAGRELNLHSTSITQVCKGKLKTCGGYHWKYYIKKTNAPL